MKKRVGIIVVSFNTRDTTLAMLRSVFDSVIDPDLTLDVVVVDNGSADGSSDAIEREFPSVKVLRSKENLGFGRANNLGARSVEGEALLLLNSDTIVHAGVIETLYESLFAADDRGIVGPYLENPDGSYQCSMMSFPNAWRTFCNFFLLDRMFPRSWLFADLFMSCADPLTERDVDVVQGAALMIRTDLFDKIGGFDPDYFMYFEEVDLSLQVSREGYKSHYVPAARVAHLVYQSSQSNPTGWFCSITRESRRIYARKNLSRLSQFLIEASVTSGYLLRIVPYAIIGLRNPKFKSMSRAIFNSYRKHNTLIQVGISPR